MALWANFLDHQMIGIGISAGNRGFPMSIHGFIDDVLVMRISAPCLISRVYLPIYQVDSSRKRRDACGATQRLWCPKNGFAHVPCSPGEIGNLWYFNVFSMVPHSLTHDSSPRPRVLETARSASFEYRWARSGKARRSPDKSAAFGRDDHHQTRREIPL